MSERVGIQPSVEGTEVKSIAVETREAEERFRDRHSVANVLNKMQEFALELIYPLNDENIRRNEIAVYGIFIGTGVGTALALALDIHTGQNIDPMFYPAIGGTIGGVAGRTIAVHISRALIRD